ncbi:hypothetical protein KC460_01715 [Candidatus Dependentiae bacterium]|nr:hypothetical protein [Candidatus Dependentiae bacterium]
MKKKALLFSVFIFLSGITILLSGKKLDKRVNAGVLPYCYDCNGVAYFLIGKEPSKVWADFGGKSEKKDSKPLATALRECAEETRYVFGKYAYGLDNLEQGVKQEKKYIYASNKYIKSRLKAVATHPKRYYEMYLAKVDFIPADVFKHAYKNKDYDKKSYAWVPVTQFMQAIKESTNRDETYYRTKKIRRQLYDILIAYHNQILNLIYPHQTKIKAHTR